MFTALCIAPTAVIGLSGPYLGTFLFIVANFAYQAALIYYDATLKLVSVPATRGRLSGVGTGIGYCGTVFVALLIQFGKIPVEARFPLAALLFALFAIPLFLVLRESRPANAQRVTPRDFLASWAQLRTTWRHAGDVPGLRRFLVGRFFYSDAVNTVIVVMTVVATEAVGLRHVPGQPDPARADRRGDRDVVRVGLPGRPDRPAHDAARSSSRAGRWASSSARSRCRSTARTRRATPSRRCPGVALFILAGAILGSGLGGVQVSDRVFMVRLSPPDRVGEFFGVYGLVGKASQVIGQVLYGAIIFLLLDSLGSAPTRSRS